MKPALATAPLKSPELAVPPSAAARLLPGQGQAVQGDKEDGEGLSEVRFDWWVAWLMEMGGTRGVGAVETWGGLMGREGGGRGIISHRTWGCMSLLGFEGCLTASGRGRLEGGLEKPHS